MPLWVLTTLLNLVYFLCIIMLICHQYKDLFPHYLTAPINQHFEKAEIINFCFPPIYGARRRSVRGSVKAAGVNHTWRQSADEAAGYRRLLGGAVSVISPRLQSGLPPDSNHEAVRTVRCVFTPLCWQEKLRDVSSQTVLPLSPVAVVSIPADSNRM